ncbi:arginine--tRNA ligase [Treponema saccharophilum]|uniref:Arginine--tRNA ligase n=1 Tax=Treponema saccharophilum DSM 2985 TaxID=907348 RepID=H7EK94_9SPIR|nr:arginine--tRNA ligase [Treponema saccharophilum]EIC01981.1 arginyl-tRNA synthetase [Treponema saccharophilum DSM 2985]BDC96518.1 arginine--tRNA ligase [Treponema saccharophilum]
MSDSKIEFKNLVLSAIDSLKKEKGVDFDAALLEKAAVVNPPKPEMGDLGVPMFVFAKPFGSNPAAIAGEIVGIISSNQELSAKASAIGEILAVGPYVNVKLDKSASAASILSKIESEGDKFGTLGSDGKPFLDGRKVMIEFSSPNTNKPLHLGHLRNDALGESVSRILKKAGAEVFKVDLINNRGIHICKSMLAYKLFHEKNGDTPESLGMKGDHFVGQCYVEFDKYLKGEKGKPETAHPEAQEMAEEMLRKWEAGDEETRKLWEMMNKWTFDGVKVTYDRTGVSFDKFYFESETYLKGKDEILKGLEKGVFFKAEDGSVRVDVTEAVGKGKDGEDHEKVLLRKDGTSVYITQDIGTAISRHKDWAFNQLVYVVASEQIFHFKVLFYILKKLGFDWAEKLYHLSYGLVNLPNGRMKSREGTVVDADDLIDSLRDDALKAIKERGREEDVGDANEVAEKVALAALHYYLLQVSPVKDMIFNPEESLSFNGNTGPYLQYMGARIASILRKADEAGVKAMVPSDAAKLLSAAEEWDLLKKLGDYPETIRRSAENFDASVVTGYIYDVAKLFSKFYQECPILGSTDENLKRARLTLASATLRVLKEAMGLVLVPYLDRM